MKKIPKILYDQTQFTPVYFLDDKGFWLGNDIYLGGKEISGYAADGWYLYTQNTPSSFFFGAYEEKAINEEAENGLAKFSEEEFLSEFEGAVVDSYEKTKELKEIYFQKFYGKEAEAVKNNADEVVEFLKNVRESIVYILSYYLLTQPQRFYSFESELKKEGLTDDTEFVSTNGHKLTYVSELRKAVLDFVQKVVDSGSDFNTFKSNDEEAYELLVISASKLGFLNWGLLGGELIDEKHLDVEIQSLLSDISKFKEEKNGLDDIVSKVEKRKELLKTNSNRGYELADVMGKVSVIRFDLQTCALCLMKYVDNFVKAAAVNNNLVVDEINSYCADEVLNLIASGEKVDASVTKQRQEGYLRIYKEGETLTFVGEEAKNEIADLLKFRTDEINQAKQLKGTVASLPNKEEFMVKGRVFVLTTAFDIEEKIKDFKEGDILVATQTHPNLVPMMKKSLAIVTDEGGITCHAAIVSRELKKPCIIGTRLASKVLKTGDEIVMNLKTGEIEIL
jgi:pyruvate,water dikinase